jgi:ATP-dependent Lhr-like helicase
MALSPALSRRVRAWIADPARWAALPDEAREWLEWQQRRAVLPGPHELLVESFPRAERWVLTAYPFAGRNAHQTLGLLLTRRMESFGWQPLGFVANDYALAVWSLRPVTDAAEAARLLDPDLLGEDLHAWMAETSVLRRTFRECAVVAGMIDRRQPGRERRSRLVTFSSDMIYDVLRRHEPDHLLLQATRQEAARGLTDAERLRAVLEEARGHLRFTPLQRVSPLSIPLLLELGREGVDGAATTALLEEEAARLLEEARG